MPRLCFRSDVPADVRGPLDERADPPHALLGRRLHRAQGLQAGGGGAKLENLISRGCQDGIKMVAGVIWQNFP